MKNLEMNKSIWKDLISKLKIQFPQLTTEDFMEMNHSAKSLIDGLSLKVGMYEGEVVSIIEDNMELIQAKRPY